MAVDTDIGQIAATELRNRMAWQKAAGYNWRALVRVDVSRLKRVIGNGLQSRTDWRRAS